MTLTKSALRRAGAGVLAGLAMGLVAGGVAAKTLPPPANLTVDQINQNMMDQLGIKSLRPARDSNAKSPNAANYDEAKANPYPNLPDALVMKDGRKVTSAEMWWMERRPQIVSSLAQDVYGRVPKHVPKVTWKVIATDNEYVGFTPVIAKKLVGHVDNASYPAVDVNIEMTLVIPANIKGPVPVLMMFGPSDWPAPNQPSKEEFARLNKAFEKLLIKQDPSLAKVFKAHPAYQPFRRTPFKFPRLNADGDPPSTWELVSAGWGYATIDPTTVQADNAPGLTRGIIGLVNKGQPRKPDDWGALRAWAWGASRGLDYLQTDPAVDAKHVGIEGVSRYGKAALVTMAFDQRFAMVLVGSSGKGGATLLRRNFGEGISNLATGENYWMAGNLMKYDYSEGAAGSFNPGDLTVDSNELIALCAPRLTFISYGLPSKGDSAWLDHHGSFMAAVAASKVFRLLGAKGLGVGDNYRRAKMPKFNHGLLDGQLAWRQDDGGHTDAPNMKHFIAWVDKNIGYTPHKK